MFYKQEALFVAKKNSPVDSSDWSLSDYIVDGTEKFSIADAPTNIEPLYTSKKDTKN